MNAAGLILSGIYSDRLDPIAGHRTVASLPFGGRYRHIDFILSSMVNSGISDVGIITKNNYQSLIDHLGSFQDWDLNRRRGGAKLIPPHAAKDLGDYRGKIEELRAGIPFLRGIDADYVVVADTLTLCSIDLRRVVEAHAKSLNDITIVVSEVKKDEEDLSELVFDPGPDDAPERIYLNRSGVVGQYSSDGIYVVSRNFLIDRIEAFASAGYYHLERDLILQGFNTGELKVGLYKFGGTVLKNRSIPEYFENSFSLLDPSVGEGLFLPDRPVYTAIRDEQPTRYGAGCRVVECIVADGSRIDGEARRSVISRGVVIEKGASVINSVIMDGCVIRSGARVENAVLDRYVDVGSACILRGSPQAPVVIEKNKKLIK